MRVLWILVATAAILGLLLLAAGQFGFLSGRQPADLGVRDGRLKAPSRTENSVSSQADLHVGSDALVEYARIAPIAVQGDAAATLQKIGAAVAGMRGAKIIERRGDYLYAQFTTRWLRFVDDVEFWASPTDKVIHVRSASRVGRKDFGVNRARVEAIRAWLAQG
jgi:uncharacterized protein (DUF1499 family)